LVAFFRLRDRDEIGHVPKPDAKPGGRGEQDKEQKTAGFHGWKLIGLFIPFWTENFDSAYPLFDVENTLLNGREAAV
jgi:hypothetical protein